MSAGESFAVVANRRRQALQQQSDALAELAAVDTRAGEAPMHAAARSRGGLVLDPVDPTMVTASVEWLRALLLHARMDGRREITGGENFRALVREYDDLRGDDAGWTRFEGAFPDLAATLRGFMGAL